MAQEAEPLWYEVSPIPALLRHARETYGFTMRAALDEAGYDDIPAHGLYILGGLARSEGEVPLGQLIREIGVTKQAAGQLVDELVLRGYLERTVNAEDRRKLNINLTERGRAAAETQRAASDRIDATLTEQIGAEAVLQMRRSLAVLIHIGHPQDPGPEATAKAFKAHRTGTN